MKGTPRFKFQVIQGKPAFGILLVLLLIGLPIVLVVLALVLGIGMIRAVFRALLGIPGRSEIPTRAESWGDREIIDVKAEVLDVPSDVSEKTRHSTF